MLERIQEHLESIYGIRSEYRAQDFLVDPESAKALGGTGRSREELLVHETDEGLELALYLEPALVARLRELDLDELLMADLGGFCEVAEGVSHFLYLSHTALEERTLSLLELEAQAEVDKFAMCLLLRWKGRAFEWAQTLVGRLFERVRLREDLSEQERWRYLEANRLAKSYCRQLLPLIREGDLSRFLSELRHSYRLGAEAKLLYFARAR
jgi:hypothetical protein